MMNTLELDYPFGDLLGDSKFHELGEYLKLHYQEKNAVNDIADRNIPMHTLIFCCG